MPPCNAFCVRFTTVSIHLVDDATGDPLVVALGTGAFTANGQPTSPWCGSDAGDTTDCSTLHFELYGPYMIQINIPGYMPAVLQTDVQANSQVCCGGPINPVDTTLRLKK